MGTSCLIYKMRAGFPLLPPAIDNPAGEAIGEIIQMLGKIPSPWTYTRFSDDGDLARDGCGKPLFLSVEPIIAPLHDQVNNTEDRLIILPNFNIELEGSKLPNEPWEEQSSSDVKGSKICPHIKDDSSLP